MERSEPSLIPEWLKGAAGPGVATTHLSQPGVFQDDGGSSFLPRHRASQQLPANDYDSPRASTSSDRAYTSSSRRASGSSSSSVERSGADRENFPQGRSHSGFTRSSSLRSYDTSERDHDGYKGDGVRGDREGEKDFRSRDRSLGFSVDDRERERERSENGMLRLPIAVLSGKYEADVTLRRSQSMGLSPRISDNGLRKVNDIINLPSVVPAGSGGLATSMQKAAFERNFPSLGADEKVLGPPMSPVNACIASPRPLWQGSPRPDLGRASSPGLTAGYGGSISTTSSSLSGGTDLWSSALAEVPCSNGNVQSNGLAAHVLPVSTASLISSASPGCGSVASVSALNMAEALTQNPPRVRTPPQVSIESQRLEELALKQSRQLIPMTPSLPKTKTLADKAKPKQLRTIDGIVTNSLKGNQPSGTLQLNSSHRSLTPARPDTPKGSQGKLLVLKSNKDGSTAVSISLKTDSSNSPQVTSHGTPSAMSIAGISVSATGVIGQRKPSFDRRGSLLPGVSTPDALAGSRARDLAHSGEDKRPSLQAQNRSDFFNALRKKAAGNGTVSFNSNKSESLLEPKIDVVRLGEAGTPEETATSVGHDSEAEENGAGQNSEPTQFLSEIHSNGDVKCSPGHGLILDESGNLGTESLAVDSLDKTNVNACLPGDSEEEEAAFMRSLGWEENAECSELTEEEINAFYQMRDRKKILNIRSHHSFRNQHCVDNAGSPSSDPSSDSESDDEKHP